jgi:hypothetical protein
MRVGGKAEHYLLPAICSSETSVHFQLTTRCYISKNRALNHRCENFISYIRVVSFLFAVGASGSVVGRGTVLRTERLRFRFPVRPLFFNLHNSFSRTMTLGLTQPLT